MSQAIAAVFIGVLIILVSAGCQFVFVNRGHNNAVPTNISDQSPLTVTVHQFTDQRPDNQLFLALVTFTNSSNWIFRTAKFVQLSCVLEDSQGNVIGYRNCSTGGLLPKQSLDLDLGFKTLSAAPAHRFVVLDGDTWETLAIFDVSAGTALAQSTIDGEAIYASETYQGEKFPSASAWSKKLEEWEELYPGLPDPINGANGAMAASRLSNQLGEGQQIRNDKWKHCLIGAAIAASADIVTAKYAGWVNEYKDLTDGDKSTTFNEIDYQATVDGATQADLLNSRGSLESDGNSSGSGGESFACSGCARVCDQRWGDRFREWNGNIPPL